MAKKMNTNSNSYTIIYATVVVVIVAFVLAFVSSSLHERQSKNVQLDKMKQILSALNIKGVSDAEAEYHKYIKADLIVNAAGEVVAQEGGFALSNDEIGGDRLPLYLAQVEGDVKYVFPVTGNGLWGGIWGYIGLNDDKNTVYGTYFSHQSETPGLGGEIATDWFQHSFIGKKVVKEGQVALSVVKGKLTDEAYQVNAISGGTITSNGVDAMIKGCLSEYVNFLSQGGAAACGQACGKHQQGCCQGHGEEENVESENIEEEQK